MNADNNDKVGDLLASSDSDDKAAGILPNLFSILMVVLLAAGVVAKNVPLESARPVDSRSVKFALSGQEDVEARLWQDPFDAVEKHRESFGAPGKRSTRHTPAKLHEHIRELPINSSSLTVVAVSVTGGTFSETIESRRRSRYAVVSALGSRGYNPESSNAIGYFRIAWPPPPRAVYSELIVPYEWYERKEWKGREEQKEAKEPKEPPPNVLVLWLNEDQFTMKPFEKLGDLFSKLTPPSWSGLNVKLIGPADAEMLRALIRDSPKSAPGQRAAVLEDGSTLEVFASGATLSNCDILASLDNQNGPSKQADLRPWDCFRQDPDYLSKLKTLPIVRTTGTDDVLAVALLWELWQRGVNRESFYASKPRTQRVVQPVNEPQPQEDKPPSTGASNETFRQKKCEDGLVVISERDTEYGRALSRHLTEGFKAHCGTDLENSTLVHTFTYLRGLDGTLPNMDKPGANALLRDGKDDKHDSNTSKGLWAQLEDAPKEHAEGRNQYDYLRRLADEIGRLDRDEKFAEHGVKAIGIVGSDVYDKILILQALRPRFKNKIFFTTDLDARYLHADQKGWTRNLVVASNFDLSLHSTLQGTTPPFRDSYQTATYLATLMALSTPSSDPSVDGWVEKMKNWLRPQIFEIGRTEAVYLASPSVNDLAGWVKGYDLEDDAGKTIRTECNSNDELFKCESIEPDRPSDVSEWLETILFAIAFGLLGLILTSRYFRTKFLEINDVMSSPEDPMRRHKTVGAIGLIVLGALLIILVQVISWIDALFERRVGEPFRWLEGVSVWPSLIVHLTGCVLMFVFTFWFIAQLRSQALSIGKRFEPKTPDEGKPDRGWWSRIWIGPHPERNEGTGGKEGINGKEVTTGGKVDSMWNNYLRATGWSEMILWILVCTVLAGGIFFGGYYVMSFPYRGELVEQLHIIETANMVLFWGVIFWVSYEMHACADLVGMLGTRHVEWPKSLLTREKGETGISDEYLVPCLNFKLIVEATARIARLIYLPFISIFFMVLAHNDVFDAMDFSPTLVIATMLAVGYVLSTVRRVRKSADAARDYALEYYETLLLQLANPQSPRSKQILPYISAEQIKLLIERIHKSHKGIFAPFTQQPGVKALLLSCGLYGTAQLVEFLINS